MLTLDYLAALLDAHRSAAESRVKEFSLAGQHFGFNSERALMGVINLSPD